MWTGAATQLSGVIAAAGSISRGADLQLALLLDLRLFAAERLELLLRRRLRRRLVDVPHRLLARLLGHR